MKKAIFTLVISVITTIAVAHPGSVLNLSVYGNAAFTVQVDQQYYGQPERFYSIRAITPGKHFIRVMKHSVRHFGVQRREIFAGYVHIPFNSVMEAFVDRYGRFNVNGIQPLFADNSCEQDPYHYYGSGPYNNCLPVMPVNQVYAMSDLDFRQLKHMIASKAFDSTRLQIAIQAVNSNYLTSSQVQELMSVMTFESTRLEFAKAAYSKTIDRQNYYLTYSAFTFESSIDELIRYTNTAG